MTTTKHESLWVFPFLYVLIFFAMVVQGAYFATGLLILNIGFLLILALRREACQLDVTLVMLIALFGIMAVSAVWNALDAYAAMIELLKYALFPLAYAVFVRMQNKERVENLFQRSFMMLMIFGLLAVVGFSVIPGMVTVSGNRLQSFLQYANTTALMMGIGALFSLDRYISARKKSDLLVSILFFAALLLTQSRTTFLLFMIIMLAYTVKFIPRKARNVLIGGMLGIVAALLLIGGRIVRISLTEPTLVERLITFRDAIFILIKKTYGMGLGVGDWQYEQFMHQSAPYQVRYVHNFFLQVGLDGGLIAMALVMGLVIFHLVRARKSNSVQLYIFVFVVLHSCFEVNFNFGIFIVWFAYLLASLNKPLPMKLRLPHWVKLPKLVFVIPALVLGVLLVSELYVTSGDRSIRSDPLKAYEQYRYAYTMNPLNRELLFKQAKVERHVEQAISFLEDSHARNSYDYQVLRALAEGYSYKKDYTKAIHYADQLFQRYPYSMNNQRLLKTILASAYESDELTNEEYQEAIARHEQQIMTKNASIHPWYRYINSNMEY